MSTIGGGDLHNRRADYCIFRLNVQGELIYGADSTGDNAAKVALIGRAPCHTDIITISLRPDVKLDGVLM